MAFISRAGLASLVAALLLAACGGGGGGGGDATPLSGGGDAIPVSSVGAGGNSPVATPSTTPGTMPSTNPATAASASNAAPLANAGIAQSVATGSVVTLSGGASTDADRDPLTYRWTLISKPTNSTAALSAATSATPTFAADRPGTYVAELVVNDGKVNSNPTTVAITAETTVSGSIPVSATWDKTNSPYALTGDVTIPVGVTLTIAPGTVVNGRDRILLVRGNLTVAGDVADRPTMNAVKLGIDRGNVSIDRANINGGYLAIDYLGTAAEAYVLTNSVVVSSAGPRLSRGATTLRIVGNVILNSAPIESPFTGSGQQEIVSNYFENWGSNGPTAAILLQANYGQPLIKYNTFASTGRQAIWLSNFRTTPQDASENYWGSTDEAVISSMIFDGLDSILISSFVTFKPFLLSPHPSTPKP